MFYTILEKVYSLTTVIEHIKTCMSPWSIKEKLQDSQVKIYCIFIYLFIY